MIPYSTCMRFNSRKRSSTDSGSFLPSEWTLIQHFDSDTGIAPAFISITSQDDQTLCFNWSLDPELRRESLASLASLSSAERRESDELDEKSVYLFLTLRRRKSLQQSIHSEAVSLLDLCYYGVTERYLRQSARWSFNTFSLDLLTGGHSLSSLLMYLFKEYGFIEHFQLDVINVLRCFYLLEKGYHDTNPYHNSVHAADVTQAMHCFLQENKISQQLTPMEAMVALLAATSHDLDHPGVNQSFLVATKSHLAALYNNFSVLESHHWRFALSCFYESHIFDHLSQAQWREIEYLLQHLILATDISRQGEFLVKFRGVVQPDSGFSLTKLEDKHFVLQIALKCADLGNPCRSWKVSQKWSEQICNEFYRQGDFERQLGLPVTSICDRTTMTIPSIQTEFFTNVVRPLFELWNVYLDSKLSRQLLNNLNFNDFMWNTLASEGKSLSRQSSGKQQRCSSVASDRSEMSAQQQQQALNLQMFEKMGGLKRSKSLVAISSTRSLPASLDEVAAELLAEAKAAREAKKSAEVAAAAAAVLAGTTTTGTKKCINGCGTPPTSDVEAKHASAIVVKTAAALEEEVGEDDDDFIASPIRPMDPMDRFNDDCGAILSTPALLLPNYYLEKSYYSYHRRGSAPGCIDIRKNDLTSKNTAALFMLRSSKLKSNASAKRRSSFPAVKLASGGQQIVTVAGPGGTTINSKSGGYHHGKSGQTSATAAKSGKCRPPKNFRAAGGAVSGVGPPSSLFDMHSFSSVGQHHHSHHPHHLPYHVILTSLGGGPNQPRRRSVPQDIFIRSLTNYTA